MSLWEGMLCPHTLQGKSSREIFLHVVTPDRIPQFTIPSLDIHKKHRRSDPTAQAALSLPHLPKVTTPYGFVTLGQSPQVTSEEALFFHSGSGYPRGPAAQIRPSSQEEPGCCRHPGMPVAGGGGCSRMDGGLRDRKKPSPHATGHKDDGGSQAYRSPAGLPLPRRCASPLRDIQITDVLESKEAEKRERRLLEVGYRRSSTSPELPAGTSRKNLLQRILRRHLAYPRQLKPTNFTLH
ncbi:PREDICTED: C2 calcium-dependent domain-containing protein 4C-like [Fulmarus glacialis]|uniref:C2 calcium-dependent domain-containing protein 4C-like n=1 Tax=Fulmarus glacialis TaxID=30455 RepID=UPI00051BCB93|nr:PREDICTED: C2 calcium-dependent domain-containing protein 4C-like [Fulmarus glacialis]